MPEVIKSESSVGANAHDAAPGKAKGLIKSLVGSWIFRLCGSLFFLGLLFILLPAAAIREAFLAIPPATLGISLVLFLGLHAIAAMKWRLLVGQALTPWLAFRAHLGGLAANLCLPGAIGGDAVRAGMAQQSVRDAPTVVASAAADRLVDLVALLALAAAGLILSWGGGANPLYLLATLPFFLLVFGGLWAAPLILRKIAERAPGLPLLGLAQKVFKVLSSYTNRPLRLAGVFFLSLSVQFCLIALSWYLADLAGATIGFLPWLFAWPLAKILAVLPVSLNGLGFRETTLAALLIPFGASGVAIVAAGLVWQVLLFLAGAVGAAVVMATGGNLGTAASKGPTASAQ